ncbi:MAG: GNAT family N-acetyltransferase [Rhodobacteraceae bacterium]|nr:GNAT family N-acetyltransferase [Paracoccaceae bacterium]
MNGVSSPDTDERFQIRMATSSDDLTRAQRLRYEVFVEELGGNGEKVNHADRLECDDFDSYADHMLLIDTQNDVLAGVYRMMRPDQAQAAGQYYCDDEYDLTPLINSGQRLLELGRSCLAPAYRGGTAMYHLWNGLADYVQTHSIEILFGVASFHGTDVRALAGPLSLLHHRHLAPEHLRPAARSAHAVEMNILPEGDIDRRAAMVAIPALIKAYLRIGGTVGAGAFVDHAFNTTDVCLVLDTARFNARQARIYRGNAS